MRRVKGRRRGSRRKAGQSPATMLSSADPGYRRAVVQGPALDGPFGSNRQGGLSMATFHVMSDAEHAVAHPQINKITIGQVWDAFLLGIDDFREQPSHYVFLCLLFPLSGIILMIWSSG